jgi:hypothetical protein
VSYGVDQAVDGPGEIPERRIRYSSFFLVHCDDPVIMRQNMIQGYSMNAMEVQPADFVIGPDGTSFESRSSARR